MSVRIALSDWFYTILDYRPRVDRSDFYSPRITPDRVNPGALRFGDCLVGHWDEPGTYLHERYPEVLQSPRFKVFTFVRDPIQLQLSLYAWERKKGKDFGPHELQEELLKRPNYMADRVPCGSGDLDRCLDRYFFIGVTDELQRSFDILGSRLGLPRVRLSHRNRSRSSTTEPDFEDGFMEEFRRVNAIDYAIYERARQSIAGASLDQR